MSTVLVDSNVLLDVLIPDPEWETWSANALAAAADHALLAINPIIYAEISIGFDRIEDLDGALAEGIRREAPMWEAAFLAGKAFLKYRRQGGVRTTPLPDFYIGAHAALHGYELLTRDAARYRSYYPKLRIIAPN